MGVVATEGIELEQCFDAALLALTHLMTQGFDGLGFGGRFGLDAASAGGAVEQQLGDQALGTLLACLALGLLVVDQALQGGAGVLEQQGQALEQAPFAILGRRHAVEAHQGVQAKTGEGFAPLRLAMLLAGDEVEHGQQGLAATGQDFQLIAVLGQHRLAGIDHIEPGIARQQLAQDLGFLFETLARLAALEKPLQPCRAVRRSPGRSRRSK